MKNIVTIAVVLLLLVSLSPIIAPVSSAGSDLADTIHSLPKVRVSANLVAEHTAYVFHSVNQPNYVLMAPYDGSAFALGEARLSELDGTGSPTSYVSSSWPRCSGANELPITDLGDFLIYYRWAYHLYDWFPASWNRGTALTQFRNAVADFPALDYPIRQYNNQRYYDEYMETADVFLGLGSVSDAVSIFLLCNDTHWNGLYWGYASMSGVECEAGPFAMLCAKLYVANGNSLPMLTSNGVTMPGLNTVVADLGYKFLNNGWYSHLWRNGVVAHAGSSDDRLRLQNTLAAWAALQMYWSYFSAAQKANMVSMLTGGGGIMSAWQILMSSPLYDPATNMFRMITNDNLEAETPSFTWTAIGLNALFMMGIVPDTGSLAIPCTEEMYEDVSTYMPATNFGFDYDNQQIKIPVRAGTLHFLFGTSESSASFPSDGIYTVQFSSDWNTVTGVNKLSGLSAGLPYLPPSGNVTPPPTTGTLNLSATYNGSPVAATVTITGPTNTVITTPASPTVTAGTYTLVAHYDSLADQTRTNVVVPAGDQATISFAFTAGSMGTLQIDAKYAGVRVAVEVTVMGTGFSQTGTTTTGSLPPLSYSVNAGSYQVSGSYQGTPLNQEFMVLAGSPTDAVLDFGGGNWWQQLWNQIIQLFSQNTLLVVGVASVGIVGGGVVIGLSRGKPQQPQRKRRRRR